MTNTAEISRDNPSCFLFMIDQSGSMENRMNLEWYRRSTPHCQPVNRSRTENARRLNGILPFVLLLCAMFLAACGGSGGGATGPTDPTDPTDPPDPTVDPAGLNTLMTTLAAAQTFADVRPLFHANYLNSGGTDADGVISYTITTVNPTVLTLGVAGTVNTLNPGHLFRFNLSVSTKVNISTSVPWQSWNIYDTAGLILYEVDAFQEDVANPSVTWTLAAGDYYINFRDLDSAAGNFEVTVATSVAAETFLFAGAAIPRTSLVPGTTDQFYFGISYNDPDGNLALGGPLSYLEPEIIIDEAGTVSVYGNQRETTAKIEIEELQGAFWDGTSFVPIPGLFSEVYFGGVEGWKLAGDDTAASVTTSGSYAIGSNVSGECVVLDGTTRTATLLPNLTNGYIAYDFNPLSNDCVGVISGLTSFAGTIGWTITGDSGVGAVPQSHTVTLADGQFSDISGVALTPSLFNATPPETFQLAWSGLAQPSGFAAMAVVFFEEDALGNQLQPERLITTASGSETITLSNAANPFGTTAEAIMVLVSVSTPGSNDLEYFRGNLFVIQE